MNRVRIVGIGTGDPDHLTVEGIRALNEIDVFLVPDKTSGSDADTTDLIRLREEICARHIERSYRLVRVPDPERDRGGSVATASGYRAAVDEWHEARACEYERVFSEEVGSHETVGFLVWGDPAFYDSTIRIVERVLARGRLAFDFDVVPGISAVQLLAARHRIVLNEIASPVVVTTGRRLRDEIASGADNLVVMLNREPIDVDGEWNIWWGANLGTGNERLVAGRAADVVERIASARAELSVDPGWVMDIYLLRRRG